MNITCLQSFHFTSEYHYHSQHCAFLPTRAMSNTINLLKTNMHILNIYVHPSIHHYYQQRTIASILWKRQKKYTGKTEANKEHINPQKCNTVHPLVTLAARNHGPVAMEVWPIHRNSGLLANIESATKGLFTLKISIYRRCKV